MSASAIHAHRSAALRHPAFASPIGGGRKAAATPFESLLEELGKPTAVLRQKPTKTSKTIPSKNAGTDEPEVQPRGDESVESPAASAKNSETSDAAPTNEQDAASPDSQPVDVTAALPIAISLPLNVAKPGRGSSSSDARRSGAKLVGDALPPLVGFAPIPSLEIPPLKEKASADSGARDKGNAALPAADPSQERHTPESAAIEIRIRGLAESAEEPIQQAGELPHKTLVPVAETAVIPVPNKSQPAAPTTPLQSSPAPHTSNPALSVAVDAPVSRSEIATSQAREPETLPAREAFVEDPPRSSDAAQPLRSVSLEFSPDGAADIRLRLSEKSGDVHITLHSADPSLTGRLHDGVNDLIGSLSHAGYEAEAWTAGQGQRQHREPEERRSRRSGWDVPGGESFGGVLQQSES